MRSCSTGLGRSLPSCCWVLSLSAADAPGRGFATMFPLSTLFVRTWHSSVLMSIFRSTGASRDAVMMAYCLLLEKWTRQGWGMCNCMYH